MSKFLTALLISATALGTPAALNAQATKDQIVVTGSQRFPVSAFGRQPFMREPRISPDGTKVVVQLAREGKGAIGIIDPQTGAQVGNAYLVYREHQHAARNNNESTTWIADDTLTDERRAVADAYASLLG